MGPSWIPAAENAVAASEGSTDTVLVGRALHDGEMVPAMVVPQQLCAFVSKDGKEYKKTKYDVLVGEGYCWELCSHNKIPPNAVHLDSQKSNVKHCIGRVLYKDTMCVGRVDVAQGCLFIPYNGEEFCFHSFDILVTDNSGDWISTSFHHTPADAVEGGRDTDGSIIYVGRAFHADQWLPAKVIPSKTCAYICHEGEEIFVKDYQILCGHGYLWHEVYGHFIPASAVATDSTADGELMYVGRGSFNGSFTPGVISQSGKCCIFPYGGKAITVTDYEVLIR